MTPATRPRSRLRVGVVGAGPVGVVLAAALARVGHRVVGASLAGDDSLARVHDLLEGVSVEAPERVVASADLVLIDASDGALPAVVRSLAQRGAWRPGQIVVHVAARYGADVLAPITAQGVTPVALHPALHISGTAVDVERLVEASIAVTTTDAARPIGEALVIEMGAEPVWVPEVERPKYAAAVSHAVGYLGVVVAQASDVLAAAGVVGSRRLLATLMVTNLENALIGSRTSQTPPDLDALERIIETLDDEASDVRSVFVAVARARAGRDISEGRVADRDLGRLLDMLAGDLEHRTGGNARG